MRALSLLAATLLVAGCSASPTPPATASSTAGPSPIAQSTVAPTVAPSPSQTAALSNPRGSAINGPIVYSTGGDVFSLDPATGVSTLIIGGPTIDEAPSFSDDGTKLVTHRSDDGMLYISGPDGSGLKAWASDRELTTWNWSPDGSRLAATSAGRTAHDLIIWDGGAGPKAHLDIDAPATFPMWVDNDTLLLVEERDDLSVNYWTVDVDGTNLKPVAALHPCCLGSLHRETSELAYSDFVFNVSTSASVHILNLGTGADSILQSTVAPGFQYLSPLWSPDGKWFVANQFPPGLPHRYVLLSATGTGVALPLGPDPATNQNGYVTFSPDSTRVLIVREDGTYLFSIPDGAGGRVDWPIGTDGPEENIVIWLRKQG